jgi:hypothetical protein
MTALFTKSGFCGLWLYRNTGAQPSRLHKMLKIIDKITINQPVAEPQAVPVLRG